jgi:hypothetical protein
MVASFNLGVWLQSVLPQGALYRWEGDQGSSGAGFVVLDTASETIRPADEQGRPLGDLLVDAKSASVSGAADGIERAAFVQVAGALLRARAKSNEIPKTAHAYYG